MKSFQRRTRIQAPLADVLAFHKDALALKRLTPPPVFVQLHEVEPLEENSRASFTMWMGPFPVRWVAVHSQVDPQRGFTDTQAQGPFEHWVHRHTFEQLDAGATEILDIIEALPGRTFISGLVSRFMWLNLPVLFWYRAWVIRRALEHPRR